TFAPPPTRSSPHLPHARRSALAGTPHAARRGHPRSSAPTARPRRAKKEGAVMKVVRLVSFVLPLAIAVSGCEHKSARVADVEAPRPPEVLEGHWVTGPQLDRAGTEAAAMPLVKRAIAENVDPRLTPMWDRAVRAEGRLLDGRKVAVTI